VWERGLSVCGREKDFYTLERSIWQGTICVGEGTECVWERERFLHIREKYLTGDYMCGRGD
jgi:hypothetical protein